MLFVSACHHTSKICVRPYLFITHVITDQIELHSDLLPLIIFTRSVANCFYHTCKISIFEKTDFSCHTFTFSTNEILLTILSSQKSY